ncbi:GPR1/FUN34/yaaH family-domain-containing protein [Xylariaceae sp. FL0804]|nr:GPR1/FUN34/yaaH family-domain-containing protein [Xylariaceae sp. FL0804]
MATAHERRQMMMMAAAADHDSSATQGSDGTPPTTAMRTHSDEEHDIEKGFLRTETSVTMPPELFEKLYLTPKVPGAGPDPVRGGRRFANPTPLGFVGFVISTFTFSMILLGWGGASGLSPVAGIFLFTGPVLLFVTMIFEWIMGNFFPMMVMGLFTVFWLSFGLLQLPTLELGSPFASSTDPTGLSSKGYNAAVALYLIVWGFALFTFFIFTLRLNLVFASLFLTVSVGAWVLGAAYFKVSNGDYEGAMRCQKAGASLLFVDGVLGWYMCFIIMAGEMRIPIKLPVGDLSHFWNRTDVEVMNAKHE